MRLRLNLNERLVKYSAELPVEVLRLCLLALRNSWMGLKVGCFIVKGIGVRLHKGCYFKRVTGGRTILEGGCYS